MDLDEHLEDDDRWLGPEYALGVLDGPRRLEAERRYDADAAFRAEVDGWTGRLCPLLEGVQAETPRPEVWAAIRERLERDFGPETAPQPPLAAGRDRVVSIGRMRFWQAATAGAGLLAAASLAVAVLPFGSPETVAPVEPRVSEGEMVVRRPVLAAALAPEEGAAQFTVMVDRGRRQAVAIPVGEAWETDRSRELWLLPADGSAPRSLGLLNAAGPTPLPLAADTLPLFVDTAQLAVSDEPPGGSPEPGPTGQVVAVGALAAV